MERLVPILETLKAFALTRPVAYGAPACALAGVLVGLAMQTGPQENPFTPEMEAVHGSQQATAEPTAWPSGKIPDYVIGTDFLQATRPPPTEVAYYDDVAVEPPPPPELPPPPVAQHGPAEPPPDPYAPRWASARGDILDVSLPEDQPQQPVPTVLADAAAAGITTR